jgi:RNA polymerase sigma factor (TIGR02999 family)
MCSINTLKFIPDITQLLIAIDSGDSHAAGQLLPLVYNELRLLAASQMAHEKPGQTLNATALVHEAYLRLIGDQRFDNRRHFFGAAAEAMRRILVEAARRRMAAKRGGGAQRQALDQIEIAVSDERLLSVHDALDDLARTDPYAATLVKLRFFGGMNMGEAADALGISVRSAHDVWAYARSWLRRKMRND